MLTKLYKIRVLTLLTSTLLLGQCTKAENSNFSTPKASAPLSAPISVVKKKPENLYPKLTSEYLAQAKTLAGSEQQNSLLMAAGRALSEGWWRQSTAILAQTADLTVAQKDEKNILLAQIDLMREHPKRALEKLTTINQINSLSKPQQVQFHESLAQAYNATDKPMESITERIKLEPLLIDEYSQKSNHRKLWLTLTHLSQVELDMAIRANSHSELEGWLQLAQISRHYRDNAKSLLAALEQWQTQYSTHPANNILPIPLDAIATKMINHPQQVALLLPLSDALKGPGTAVRDGFFAAYKNAKDVVSMNVKTYDTSKGDVIALYQTAVSEGADYIVGPLIKSQVAAVAAIPHPVPTLLLNDSDTIAQENSYLFGLSPLNEAVQVAIKAHRKGYSRALVIAPGNVWGMEVTKAFGAQWQKKGGTVVDTFLYSTHDDLNKKMRDFLHISQGQQREKRLKELLGYHIQSVISRRQDFDMIFLLAYPSKARQIMPLLKYYFAADIPVFATASVYGGNKNALKDKDLDGIIFCDIPWVFSHQMRRRNWPEQFNSYNRLYSLGKDSYALATQLNQLILFPADESTTGDGILYLKPSQHVARVLAWGQFRQGVVHSLDEAV
ncbi:MAG: penicillin-binding protein activator [Legionella sp.]|uniref:penicillin-binding protein activator n=1 Tax=Legionella sp. TaxID=459 RepID=UPI0039E2D8B3